MPSDISSRRREYRIIGVTLVSLAAIGLVIIGIVLVAPLLFSEGNEEPNDDPAQRSFDGDSKSLLHTVVVPTLDTPIPAGKSAIWCSTLQIAWNRFKKDLTKGPVQLENAETVAERLNRAEQSEEDLSADSYYAAAGFVKDGIVPTIRQEMAKKFPDVSLPEFGVPPDGAVMYGYLRAKVRFTHFFHDELKGLNFTDSSGGRTTVRAFGVPESKKHDSASILGQVRVLFRERGVFGLDLCASSWPNQIVVARMDRKDSLAATLDDFRSRVSKAREGHSESTLGSTSTLLVPILNWRLDHHFDELAGVDKRLMNPNVPRLYLRTAVQTVQFKLDRYGASVESTARGDWYNGDPPPDQFHFDRPFLIAIKRRGAKHPFFVMWVDNSELLDKQ